MAGEPGSERETAGYTAVRVKNFDPKTTDTKILQDAFSSCGDVRSAILAKGLGGQSTGAGYIHFEDHQAARAAVEKLNGMEMNGFSVEVEPAHGAPGGADRHSARSASIFVKGFGPEVGIEALKEAFRDAGDIVSAVVMRDQSGASRGFGFVNFEQAEAADRAVANFDDLPSTHAQSTWLVRRALPKTPKQEAVGDDPCTLYVRGLQADVDRDRLEAMFQAFGPITSCRILSDPKTGISRCAGLLRFESPEKSMRAIRDMHGRQVGERRLHVTIAQNGPRFQKNAVREGFEQPRPPPGVPMMGMYPGSFPMGIPQRFPGPPMGSPVVPVGSPDQAQMLAAAQQGHMHPGYAMYGPGMMYMGPQGYPQPMWPSPYFPGRPFSGSPMSEYSLMQQYQQQAQQFGVMTSGQEGAYFDVVSNSFWDSGRGFRGVPIPAPPRRSRRGSRHGSKKTLATSGQSDRDSGPTGSLQEAAERASSTEGSLVQAGEPSMPLPGARSLSDGQLDSLMGQLAGMPDEKGRKDLLGGHLFALLEEEHSEQLAAEITSALLAESEGEILHMLRARDALDSQVTTVLQDMGAPAGGSPGSSGRGAPASSAQAAQPAQEPSPSTEASAFGRMSLS